MKWATNEQDVEDYEQEKAIEKWLSESGNGNIDLKYITSKGTPRNTLIKASISLDQEISEDGGGTFADLIAGCDGRDMLCGGADDEPRRGPKEQISWYLLTLKFNEEQSKWLLKTFLSYMKNNERRLLTFLTDSE